jgi:hypothetical protein
VTLLLDNAILYHQRGWRIIPTAGKKAHFDWKQFQKDRPTEQLLGDWFCRLADGTTGIAVLTGAASGGLAVRDFDREDAYQEWAGSHPGLAAGLPTVQTKRGRHVYFRAERECFVNLDDGELRADGKHYVLAPPSLHPSGIVYRWANPLPQGPLPVLDPRKAGLLPHGQGGGSETQAIKEHRKCLCLTLPGGPGRRNRRLFQLARKLKGIPHLAGARAEALEPIVRQWHRLALPVITTKDWQETWEDFRVAWERVECPSDPNLVRSVFAAVSKGLPPVEALVKTAERLAGARGDGTFFITARLAGELVGLDKTKALKLLKKTFDLVEPGDRRPGGRANVYRLKGERGPR